MVLGVPYPNPFRSDITIPFAYSHDGIDTQAASLTIMDSNGKEISKVTRENSGCKGLCEIEWNGLTESGSEAPSGIYYYRLGVIRNGIPEIFAGKLIKQ